MILKNFVFFDSTSSALTSNAMANESKGKSITLQVTGLTASPSFSFQVQGLADLNQSDSYQIISTVKLSNFDVYDTITSEGTYIIPVDGIYKIRLVATSGVGTFKAQANLTD